MQRGPLLQPIRSTELVLSGPPRAHPSGCCSAVPSSQGSARTGSRPRTATGLDGLNVFTCPAPPKKQTHPLGGFSSRRLLSKSLTPFPGGSPPQAARFPLRRIRLTPFPQSCHGLCAGGTNRASPAFQPISVVGCFTPEPSPTKTRARILARVFSGPSSSVHPQQPFLAAVPPLTSASELPPLLRRRRSGSLAGGAVCLASGFRLAAIPPLGVTASRYTVSARPSFQALEFFLPTSGISNPWKITNRKSAISLGPPLRGPP